MNACILYTLHSSMFWGCDLQTRICGILFLFIHLIRWVFTILILICLLFFELGFIKFYKLRIYFCASVFCDQVGGAMRFECVNLCFLIFLLKNRLFTTPSCSSFLSFPPFCQPILPCLISRLFLTILSPFFCPGLQGFFCSVYLWKISIAGETPLAAAIHYLRFTDWRFKKNIVLWASLSPKRSFCCWK